MLRRSSDACSRGTISERKDIRVARRLQGFGHHQLMQSVDLETVDHSENAGWLNARRPNHQIGRQKATVGGVHSAGIDGGDAFISARKHPRRWGARVRRCPRFWWLA